MVGVGGASAGNRTLMYAVGIMRVRATFRLGHEACTVSSRGTFKGGEGLSCRRSPLRSKYKKLNRFCMHDDVKRST